MHPLSPGVDGRGDFASVSAGLTASTAFSRDTGPLDLVLSRNDGLFSTLTSSDGVFSDSLGFCWLLEGCFLEKKLEMLNPLPLDLEHKLKILSDSITLIAQLVNKRSNEIFVFQIFSFMNGGNGTAIRQATHHRCTADDWRHNTWKTYTVYNAVNATCVVYCWKTTDFHVRSLNTNWRLQLQNIKHKIKIKQT